MKRWTVKHEYIDSEDVLQILLENRGIVGQQSINEFLNPPKVSYWIEKLPKDFKDSLKNAKQLINEAIQKNEPIIIHGDYDADGVCSTAILYKTLADEMSYKKVFYFIPNRFKHGYGLSEKSLTEVSNKFLNKESPAGLLITVDSGITAVHEVDFAKKLGFKVIITDHHQKPDRLPKADCFVWTDQVVASTIAWILSRVLGSTDQFSIVFAALATVTDLQPVLGFNRSILKIGLEILNTTPPLGLQKLLEVAGRANIRITSYDLAWVLGPRLNASGRLVEAEDSLKLLLEKDPDVAGELALKLNTVNVNRQDKTLEMFDLASGVDADKLPKIIFSARDDYHEGIIGLVAAKLTQKYYRPSIVVSLSDGFGKGSVRSIAGVNIIEILRECEELFESLGGHPMAAGFSIKTNRLNELEKKLIELGEKFVTAEHLVRVLNIDLKIPIEMADIGLLNKIGDLAPFGIGNEEPVFASENLSISSIDKVGKDLQHISIKFYSAAKIYKGIWFSAADRFEEFKIGDVVNACFTLNKNEYNGKVYVDLVIRDLQKKIPA